MAICRRSDIDIYYERIGIGPRLLVFNGSGATIESSRDLVEALARNFDVVIHDQRGLGRTGLPREPESFTMADYAADAAAVLEHVGWETARVFGISFGGMAAQEFAVRWPARVERLALLCTSAGGDGGSSYPLHELETMEPAERAKVALHNLDTRFTPSWLALHPRDMRLVETVATRANSTLTPEQMRGVRGQIEARAHHDVWNRLDNISSPTLVAAGRYDGLAPVENSRAIASKISHAELREYEGGHLFVFQDRAALTDITAFLAQ